MVFLMNYFQGVSEEELLRQQQELFARAREQQAQVREKAPISYITLTSKAFFYKFYELEIYL